MTVEPPGGVVGLIHPNICDGRSPLDKPSYSHIPVAFRWQVNDAAFLKVLWIYGAIALCTV